MDHDIGHPLSSASVCSIREELRWVPRCSPFRIAALSNGRLDTAIEPA
jgi:hypothetical protein